jgi:hypothetical protein
MFNWLVNIFKSKSKYSKAELQAFDKIGLEEIGRSWGIELDRRETKAKLIKELLKIMV